MVGPLFFSVRGEADGDDARRTRCSDEQRLAELGYKQELEPQPGAASRTSRSRFTIISILAGCFTTYGQAWNNGGPVAISWGWPLISIPS